jgi:hypothetical protein
MTEVENRPRNTKWVSGFGEGAKVRSATWYPVKLDGVSREVLCTKDKKRWQLRDDAAKILEYGNPRDGFESRQETVLDEQGYREA